MELIKIITLGIVQGLTEFLPVSSSGHLVIFQNIFNVSEPPLTIDIFLHAGTLLAVFVVFRKDILKLLIGFVSSLNIFKRETTGYGKITWLILAANIPAGIVGVFFKDKIELFFHSTYLAFIFLIVTGIILYFSKFCKTGKFNLKNINLPKSIMIGLTQMISILPGISRSGITITTAMALKIKREDAAKFSFFIMIPAVAGATLLEILKISELSVNFIEVALGMLASFITGYFAIKLLLKIIKSYKMHYFAYYCIVIGILGLIFQK